MSLLIKGLEITIDMPTRTNMFLMYDEHKQCYAVTVSNGKGVEIYKVEEIQAPHGRLIDADAFEDDMNTLLLPMMINKYGEEDALRGIHFSFRDHICNIQAQRTVVEAEAAAAAERKAKVKSPVIRKMVPLDHLKRCADLCISVGWTLEQFRKNMDEWEGDALDITVTG